MPDATVCGKPSGDGEDTCQSHRVVLSETAEFLLGSLYGAHQQVCPTCAAKMMGCTREEMVKAIKELILNGLVLAENGICSACQDAGPVARLRQSRFRND